MIASLLLTVLPLLAPADSDEPDLVVLADGKEVACRVLYEDSEKVVYRARRKNREVARDSVSQVVSIERSLKSFLEAYDAMPARTPAALLDLAAFCEQHDLPGEARSLWIRVLTLDPVNEAAWTKLGGVHGRTGWRLKVRGRFYTLDELRERVSDWKNAMELPTAHFLIKTDIAPERALDVSLSVERAYLTFYEVFGPLLGLYVFDEIPEIEIFSDARNYPVPPTPGRAWFSLAANTLYVDASSEAVNPSEVVANLTYALVYNAFHRTLGKEGSVAPWARRALAEAFGLAVRVKDGRPSWEFGVPYLPHFQSQARDKKPLPIKKLLGAGIGAFDTGSDGQRYAAQAYTLAYFLVHGNGERYRAGFADYLRSSYLGKGSATHLAKALGVDLDDLEAEWIAYVTALAGQ